MATSLTDRDRELNERQRRELQADAMRHYARELHDRPVPCCPRCGANPRREARMVVGMSYVVCGRCQKIYNR